VLSYVASALNIVVSESVNFVAFGKAGSRFLV